MDGWMDWWRGGWMEANSSAVAAHALYKAGLEFRVDMIIFELRPYAGLSSNWL